MKILVVFFLIFFLICSSHSFSEVINLSDLLDTNQIVIIGEKTGNVETAQFLTAFVDEYTKDGKCIKVALELGADQQDRINRSVEDLDALTDLEIRGVYDRVSNLGIITNLNKLIRSKRCVAIYAVGPPSTVPVESGGWIEKELPKLLVDSVPVLLVVELKESLKYYNWNSSGAGKPFLAERLQQKGYKVASVLNSWRKNYCEKEKVETISSDDPLAGSYVTNLIYSDVQFLPKKSSTVTDAVNLWKCDIDVKKEAEKLIDENKIKKALRQNRPVAGMNKEQVVKAIGEPFKKNVVDKNTENWEFNCSHEDGFDFYCYRITFAGDIAVQIKSY
ncbi:MAG: hypothetical protein ACRENO_06305 [Thermodesulfobacteriota bacterium]